jgi:hypothetical protein
MQFRTNGMLLLAILCFCVLANGDIPPDPGFKRVSLKLMVEPMEDFPDYRFFIKSGADLKEIVLKKGESYTIEPLGGGAFYRNGIFLAVPRKSLESLNESPSNEKLSELQKAIYDGKVGGTIELIKHSFAREVREAEAAGWKDAVYRIEKDAEKGLIAVQVSGGANESKTGTNSGLSSYSKELKTPLFWATVGGGSLLTLAFISFGVWFIRRRKAKTA